jgi:hypothetical protein
MRGVLIMSVTDREYGASLGLQQLYPSRMKFRFIEVGPVEAEKPPHSVMTGRSSIRRLSSLRCRSRQPNGAEPCGASWGLLKAGPRVRIRLPPAASPVQTSSVPGLLAKSLHPEIVHTNPRQRTAASSLRELDGIIANDPLSLSPRITTLRVFRNKLRPEPAREPLPPPKLYAPPRAIAARSRASR